MAGYVCTIASGKGGVGKTTTAINTAAALEEAGYDVVIVDADLGMANLAAMLDVAVEDSIHDVLAEGTAVSEALSDVQGGITIVPGEDSLEAFADADPAELSTVIKTVRNAYDVVLVDTGAGLSHETAVPLGLADGVLLVTTPDSVAVGDAIKTGELTDRVGGEVLGVVLNRATATTDVEGIADRFDADLLAVIPDDTAAAGAEPLVLNSPDSASADAYRRFADRLADVFFENVDPGMIEPAVEREWFADGRDREGDGGGDDGEEGDGDGDEPEGGRFGGLFG